MVDAADGMDMTPAHCPRLEAGPSSEGLTGSKRAREDEADQEEAITVRRMCRIHPFVLATVAHFNGGWTTK
jgi:hypothetical protein